MANYLACHVEGRCFLWTAECTNTHMIIQRHTLTDTGLIRHANAALTYHVMTIWCARLSKGTTHRYTDTQTAQSTQRPEIKATSRMPHSHNTHVSESAFCGSPAANTASTDKEMNDVTISKYGCVPPKSSYFFLHRPAFNSSPHVWTHTVPALHESETFQATTVHSAGSLDVLNHTYVHS